MGPQILKDLTHKIMHKMVQKVNPQQKQVRYGQMGSRTIIYIDPGIPTTIKTMGVNIITTIVYLRVLIIQIGSTIILMVVEA